MVSYGSQLYGNRVRVLVKYKVFKIIAKKLTGKQTQLARADLIPSSESDLEAVACTVCM